MIKEKLGWAAIGVATTAAFSGFYYDKYTDARLAAAINMMRDSDEKIGSVIKGVQNKFQTTEGEQGYKSLSGNKKWPVISNSEAAKENMNACVSAHQECISGKDWVYDERHRTINGLRDVYKIQVFDWLHASEIRDDAKAVNTCATAVKTCIEKDVIK